MAWIKHTVSAMKSIALVAHDNRKDDLIQWCMRHNNHLVGHLLYATGTTGKRLEEALRMPITKMLSGPMGGDQQLGALIAEKKLDLLIFFWDPMNAQPHDPDVKALLRLAAVWNLPVACNESTADFMFSSPLLSGQHERYVPDYDGYLQKR
jgi:methylglyoxal synthase